jgi:hypothetical protein
VVSEATSANRPGQVTLAGWLIIIGSVFVVITAFETISGLHTVEVRESVRRALREPPANGLGIGTETGLTILRVLAMIAGGCAAAAAILGWHVLQRHRGARLALTVLAVPLLISGFAAGGFMSTIVAVAAIMLWTPPARDWFDGRQRERVSAVSGGTPPPAAPLNPPPPPPSEEPPFGETPEPRAVSGFGTPPEVAPGAPAPVAGQPTAEMTKRGVRPAPLVLACTLTWVCSVMGLVGLVLTGALLASNQDRVLDEAHKQNPNLADDGITDDMLMTTLWMVLVVFALWGIAAMVLAYLTWIGQDWARITLIVSTCAVAVIALMAAVSAPPILVVVLAAGAAVYALIRPEVSAWTSSRPPVGGGARGR